MKAVVLGEAVTAKQEAVHRHTSHEHEHEFEPAPGLPEPLPAGEHVLWQGVPDWRLLARECFHVRKLAVYFALLVAWRVESVVTSGSGLRETVVATGMAIGLAAIALGLAALMAWMSARTTLYTITNRRVVMRVGIVLSVTFNLPFRKIDSAGLHPLSAGRGDIALALEPTTRIAYPHLWPHVRPWHVARTQPSLRCIDDAQAVAETLTNAWRLERGADVVAMPAVARPVASPLRPAPNTARPARALDAAQAA